MNTVLFGLSTMAVGMLVVFCGLAILIICITVMTVLNKRSNKQKTAAVQEIPAAMPPVSVQEQKEEADDALIAVITAAIASVWQDEETGFVVRRVKRVSSSPAWQRAGRDEQVYGRM